MNAQFSKRFGIMKFSVLIVFLLLLSCDQKELKGEFTFTYYNQDEGMKLVEAFEEKHPGVKINLQIYQFSYFEHGKPETDVCVIEDAFIKRAVNRPDYLEHLLEDLSEPPYNAEELASKMIPYTVDLGRDDDGKIRALANIATPGAIGYRREIAKKYLGTDDPDAISEMLSSTENILETAKKLKDGE